MRNIFIVAVVCIYIAGAYVTGYSQCGSTIEQSESQMEESLDSEMSSEQAQDVPEESKADEEFEAGEAMTL